MGLQIHFEVKQSETVRKGQKPKGFVWNNVITVGNDVMKEDVTYSQVIDNYFKEVQTRMIDQIVNDALCISK